MVTHVWELVATFDPDIIKEVLINTGGSFDKIPSNPLSKMLFEQGVTGLARDKWAIHRRIASQAFNMEPVKDLLFDFSFFFN